MISLEELPDDVPSVIAKAGFDLQKVFGIDFYFYSDSATAAQHLHDRLTGKGFDSSVRAAAGEEQAWLILASKQMDVRKSTLREVAQTLLDQMDGLDVEYDGWEAGLIDAESEDSGTDG